SAPRRAAAVLRFKNLSTQPADAWLSTALAEMLATELGGGGQLRIVAPDAVAQAEHDASAASGPDAGATLAQVRQALAVDFVVNGSFAVGAAPGRPVRLDVQVLRAAGDSISVTQTGTEAALFALVTDTGRALRQRLGIDDNSPAIAQAIRAALPQSVEATRLYAEGLERLRALEAVTAGTLLARAAALEPGNALIQAALASAWTALGYDARAVEAAQRAFDAADGLSREQRLVVEGQLHEARKDWPRARDIYRTLWGFFSDNGEYGLRLAAAQTAAGRAADALITVTTLRALPPPQGNDPRVDLAESQAASALGDFPHELKAAEQAVARAREQHSLQLQARARIAEGRSRYNQGQSKEAEAALDEARAAFTAAGDRAGLAGALNSLGTVADDRGDTARAERLYNESLAASAAVGDRRGMSSALNNLGILLKDHGRLVEARQMHERALAIRREIGDRNWTAVSLNNIGVVLYEQDKLQDAAGYYSQSLAIARAIGDKRGEVRALHNAAVVQRELGDVVAARTNYELAVAARAAINDRRGGVMARVELGVVQLAQGEFNAARRTEDEAVALSRAVPLVEGEANATHVLGDIALAQGDFAAARRHYDAALALREKLGQTRIVHESEVALGALAIEDGRFAEAERLVQPALAPGAEQTTVRLQALLVLARARLGEHDVPGARRALTSARALAASTERIMSRWALDTVEARIDLQEGRIAPARARLSALRAVVAKKGLVLAELETRLLLADAAAAAHDPNAARDLATLTSDATARGAGLIARLAARLGARS
ncbi:MAG: tetratricopeptide repeat protein, partial [Acidobacteriota bacterium]